MPKNRYKVSAGRLRPEKHRTYTITADSIKEAEAKAKKMFKNDTGLRATTAFGIRVS